jgi:hypothetical protein
MMTNPRRQVSQLYQPTVSTSEIELVDQEHRLPPNLTGSEAVDWRDVNWLGQRIIDLETEFGLTSGDPTERYRYKQGDDAPSWDRGDWLNVRDFSGVVGDGINDDTAGIAAAFTEADASSRPVFFPPGTYKTHPIDYRMQSFFGVSTNQCTLLGYPGEDIIVVNPTIGQFYRGGGTIHDITFKVDDSVDASAAYPNRNGVGNAAYANDYNDKSAIAPPSAIDWQYYNIQFIATSTTVGGRNNSCGIYTQSNHFTQFRANGWRFAYLRYGWKDSYPNLNYAPGQSGFSRDHSQVDFLHFLRCGYQWTVHGWGIGEVSNVMFHGGPSIVDLDCSWNYMHLSAWEMVGNSATQNFFTNPGNYKNTYEAVSISSNTGVIWNENDSYFSGNINAPAIPLPWLRINGHRNRFQLTAIGDPTVGGVYGYNFVQDLGINNEVVGTERFGPKYTFIHTQDAMTPDGRRHRQRDVGLPMLGHLNPMPISASDLLINPRELRLTSGSVPTSWDYVPDPDADFGLCFRRVPTNGQIVLDNNNLNGLDGFKVGYFLPASRLQVSVKCKLATAGTLTWSMEAPVGTARGAIITPPVGTTYTTITWNVDLTGVAAGTTCRLSSGVPSGGGVGPIDVAWILFRPWAKDWFVEGSVVSGAVVSKTGAYTVTGNDDLITVDATAGAVTISLMPGASTTKGQVFTVKKMDSSVNAVTVTRVTNGTIDGVNSILLRDQWDSVTLRADGTNFSIVSRVGAELRGTATLDFPSIATNACAELTMTVTGAAVGDLVWLGPPAALDVGLLSMGFVSAANTVKVRVCNQTAAAIDPVSATWNAMVAKVAVG